jgi:hypothetical protein
MQQEIATAFEVEKGSNKTALEHFVRDLRLGLHVCTLVLDLLRNIGERWPCVRVELLLYLVCIGLLGHCGEEGKHLLLLGFLGLFELLLGGPAPAGACQAVIIRARA